MIKIITAYKTFDGKVFDDVRAAREHDESLLCEQLDSLLTMAFSDNGNVTRADIVKAVNRLSEARLEHWVRRLNDMLQFDNDEVAVDD